MRNHFCRLSRPASCRMSQRARHYYSFTRLIVALMFVSVAPTRSLPGKVHKRCGIYVFAWLLRARTSAAAPSLSTHPLLLFSLGVQHLLHRSNPGRPAPRKSLTASRISGLAISSHMTARVDRLERTLFSNLPSTPGACRRRKPRHRSFAKHPDLLAGIARPILQTPGGYPAHPLTPNSSSSTVNSVCENSRIRAEIGRLNSMPPGSIHRAPVKEVHINRAFQGPVPSRLPVCRASAAGYGSDAVVRPAGAGGVPESSGGVGRWLRRVS